MNSQIKKPVPVSEQQGINKANKVLVFHKYSQDGRNTEAVLLGYDPNMCMSLFLLEQILDTSSSVSWYRVYDELGKTLPPSVNPDSKRR